MELFFLFAGGGAGGPGEIAGLEHQKKGLANDNPELKGEVVKDFVCFRGSRHDSLPVPVDQECQAAYLEMSDGIWNHPSSQASSQRQLHLCSRSRAELELSNMVKTGCFLLPCPYPF